jgi:hypothetical protein
VSQNEADPDRGIDAAFVRMLDPSALGPFRRATYDQRDEHRFFGSLPAPQRDSAARGQPIPYNVLTPYQKGLVHNLVFNSGDGPMLAGQGGRGGGRMGAWNSLLMERTQVLPTGVPANTIFTLQANVEAAVVAHNSETGASRLMTINDLAQNRVAQQRPELQQFAQGMPKFDKYQPASVTQYRLTWTFAPLGSVSRTLTDGGALAGSQAVEFNALPAATRQQIEQRFQRINNMLERANRGDRGGRGPGQPTPPRR